VRKTVHGSTSEEYLWLALVVSDNVTVNDSVIVMGKRTRRTSTVESTSGTAQRTHIWTLGQHTEITITPYSDEHRPRSLDGEEQLRALYVLHSGRRLAGWPCTPPTRCTASTT
jgi:hypothetical protein